jgi:hypothetical protein
VAYSGKALHEFKDSSALRLVSPPNLSQSPHIVLQVDFYASSQDRESINEFDAFLGIFDNTHPGYEILGFKLISGPGPGWKDGVNIELNVFNGADNNFPIHPEAGQNLAWDAWHRVTLIAHQTKDHYVSLTVDGRTDDLSAYPLPRFDSGNGIFERGEKIQKILTHIIQPSGFKSQRDHIYWDNLSILVARRAALP